jgi:hypothetical protein
MFLAFLPLQVQLLKANAAIALALSIQRKLIIIPLSKQVAHSQLVWLKNYGHLPQLE